jgi:hypothetical protein
MSLSPRMTQESGARRVRSVRYLDALERDHDWLLQGDVFTSDVITTWITYKQERELTPVNLRPVDDRCEAAQSL